MKAEQVLAWVVVAFMVFALLSRLAGALPVPVKFRNPGETLPYESVDLHTADGFTTYSSACAPGATCEVTADLPVGEHEAWLTARSGHTTSGSSNIRTLTVDAPPYDCLSDIVCRADFDGSGTVTVADFGAFLSAMGASWR